MRGDDLRQLQNARIPDLVLGEIYLLDGGFHGLKELVRTSWSYTVTGQFERGRVQRRN